MIRHTLRLAAVTGLALGAFALTAGSPGAQSTGPVQTQELSCTGAAVSWVVPANVNSVTIEAWGAQGGIGDDGQLIRPSSAAGLGGYTKATIATTPGETLQVNVGCKGSDSLGGAQSPGGFGGSPGGKGGGGGDLAGGGAGGGSSDVRQGGTALANRAVVAGGGGGSGGANGGDLPAADDGHGGDGGGAAGVNGAPTANLTGGGFGTQAANGLGGGNDGCTATFKAGQAGTDGAGGDGGTQPSFGAGGGGGGGYKGGGGGAGCVNGSGGGGGSGFALASASGVTQTAKVQTGNGRVVLTYAVTLLQPAFTG